MKVTVSTHEPEPTPKATDDFCVINQSQKTALWQCGHAFPVRFAYNFYGETRMPREEHLTERKQCGNCVLADIKAHTIRCGQCGFIIMPRDGLACYADDQKIFTRRDWITFFEGGVIGCMRWDCCPSGGFFFGNWDGEKIIPRFSGATVVEEIMHTKKPASVTTKIE